MLVQWQPCVCWCVWPVVIQAAHSVSRTIHKNLLFILLLGGLKYTGFNSAILLNCLYEQCDKLPQHCPDFKKLAETSPKDDDVNAWLKKQITCLVVKIIQRVYAHEFAESAINSLIQLQARNEIQRRKVVLTAIVLSASILSQNSGWVPLFSMSIIYTKEVSLIFFSPGVTVYRKIIFPRV